MAKRSGIFAKRRLTPGQLRAEAVISRPDLLDVGMILTVAPDELPQE
jgi:hypothetical protein